MSRGTHAAGLKAELDLAYRARRASRNLSIPLPPIPPRPCDFSNSSTAVYARHPWSRPLPPTREMCRLVDDYLDGKGKHYHAKLSAWMGEIEQTIVVARTTTPDMPWLQVANPAALDALWTKRLSVNDEEATGLQAVSLGFVGI